MAQPQKAYQTLYGPMERHNPQYNFVPINLAPGASTTVITTSAGGQTLVFTIPAEAVYNLSKSEIAFDFFPTSGGGSGTYNWTPKNTHIFSRITMEFVDSVVKAPIDLKFANLVQRVVAPYCTNKSDLDNFDLYQSSAGTFDTRDNVEGRFFRKTNNLSSANPEAARYKNEVTSVNYNEFQYVEVGGNNTATPKNYIRMPLGAIYHSLLEVDRNIGFPTAIKLIFEIAPSGDIYWNSGSPTDSTAATVVAGSSVTVENIVFLLAQEVNPLVISDYWQLIKEGKIDIPFEYTTVQSQQVTGTSQSYSADISNSLGLRVKRIYNVLTNGTLATYNRWDISNITNAKYTTVETFFGTYQLQRKTLNTSSNDDYSFMVKKDMLKGTCIYNTDIFKYNCAYVDYFESGSMASRNDIYQNIIQGWPLTTTLNHTVNYTGVSTPNQIFKIIVTQKILKLRPGSIEVLPK